MGAGVQRTGAGKHNSVRTGDAGVSEIETDGRWRGQQKSEVCKGESESMLKSTRM